MMERISSGCSIHKKVLREVRNHNSTENKFTKVKLSTMKKSSINLLLIVMTSVGFAQFSTTKLDQSYLREEASLNTNIEYLNEVQNRETPRQVRQLEEVVTLLDLSRFPQYEEGGESNINVTFKSYLGRITALYDANGKIISVTEQFKNFALPYELAVAILKEYPQWEITKSFYKMKYITGQGPKKDFRVQISNGKEARWLDISSEGDIS